MNLVIRRILLCVAAVVTLSACGAAEQDAISVGETSISQDGLVDLVVAVNPGGPVDGPLPQLSARAVRDVGNILIQDLASVEYLRSTGVELDQARRDEIKEQIEQAIAEQRLGPIDRTSDGYEALTYNVWIASQQNNLASEEAQAAVARLVQDADVASRIGEVDPESRLLVPRG